MQWIGYIDRHAIVGLHGSCKNAGLTASVLHYFVEGPEECLLWLFGMERIFTLKFVAFLLILIIGSLHDLDDEHDDENCILFTIQMSFNY